MSVFEIKSAQLSLVALVVKTTDDNELNAALQARFGPQGDSPAFFDHDQLVLDFSHLPAQAERPNLPALINTLRECRLDPVAFRAAPAAWQGDMHLHGLVAVPADAAPVRKPVPQEVPDAPAAQVVEVVREVVREVPGPGTMVVDKPLRSGQKVYARGADLVVLAMVNQGAEVVADGHIHVYAPLRGKAMAGARGNTSARIFSLCLEPELVSIAGVYRTSENPFPANVAGRPAQVRLSADGQDRLLFDPLSH